MNVQLMDGLLILQLLLGNAEKDVEIILLLELNNAKMVIQVIQMDARIVNIFVELVVLLVIILIKLV